MENVEKIEGALEAIAEVETFDELDKIIEALNGVIKAKQRSLQEGLAKSFSVGDNVRFNNKKGDVIEAKVIKVNTKTLKVKEASGTIWNVSTNLLTKIS
jgi:hypothetical protein